MLAADQSGPDHSDLEGIGIVAGISRKQTEPPRAYPANFSDAGDGHWNKVSLPLAPAVDHNRKGRAEAASADPFLQTGMESFNPGKAFHERRAEVEDQSPSTEKY